jgi:hypothetical protein
MRKAACALSISTALLLLGAGTMPPSAFGCGFDGLLGDGFGAMHPKSVTVAFAISDAVGEGIIGKAAVAPIVPGSEGYWRAVGRLNTFERLMSAAHAGADPNPSVSVLFADSRLWARLSPRPSGYDMQMHTPGAAPEDVVIVTSELILAAVIDGVLPVQTALDRGLIAIDGRADDIEMVRKLVVEAMEPARVSAALQRPAKPVRLFGPKP